MVWFFCPFFSFGINPSKYSHKNPVLPGEFNEILIFLVVQRGISLPCKEIKLKAVRPYRGVFIDGTRPRLQELINIVFLINCLTDQQSIALWLPTKWLPAVQIIRL